MLLPTEIEIVSSSDDDVEEDNAPSLVSLAACQGSRDHTSSFPGQNKDLSSMSFSAANSGLDGVYRNTFMKIPAPTFMVVL